MVTGVVIFALPVYYAWKLVASFRRKGVPHWPPAVCLGLWSLQWPFAIVSAVGCLGGGCVGDPVRNWLELIGVLAYNLGPAYWLWRRSGTPIPDPSMSEHVAGRGANFLGLAVPADRVPRWNMYRPTSIRKCGHFSDDD